MSLSVDPSLGVCSPKVLIIGEVYSSNLGDAVIVDVVRHIVEKRLPAASITYHDLTSREHALGSNGAGYRGRRFTAVFQRAVRSLSWRTGIRPGRYHELPKPVANILYQALTLHVLRRRYDVVIYAGGQLVLDFFAVQLHINRREFLRAGIPVIFNAIGYGRVSSAHHRELISRSLSAENVVSVTCRDNVEQITRMLDSGWLGGDTVQWRPDPALLAATVYAPRSRIDHDIVGIGVIDISPEFESKLFLLVQSLVSELELQGRKWLLFTNGQAGDVRVAADFAQRLGRGERGVAPRPEEASSLVELVGSFAAIVSCRLHSLILAASLNVPSIGVSWDGKVAEFMRSIGCPERSVGVDIQIDRLMELFRQAELTGYDREEINRQAELSRAGLIADIDHALMIRQPS